MKARPPSAYGVLLRYEGKPAEYQEARIGALRRELYDVQREFDQLASTEIKAVDAILRERSRPPIPTTAATASLETSGSTTAARSIPSP